MAFSPTKWRRSTLLTVVGLVTAVPLVVAYFDGRTEARQNQRDDELVQKFECWPPGKCVADFNGDGIVENIAVADREAVMKVSDREVFRTAFDYQDGTFRTHFAINTVSGKPTLLIYDGV